MILYYMEWKVWLKQKLVIKPTENKRNRQTRIDSENKANNLNF